jgi:AraC-like DNA-binding protein
LDDGNFFMTYRIDLFSTFIFLGIVQGIFLLFFFLSSENRKNEVNLFHALFLFSITACIFEIFLMYTGYIMNMLYLVDFSEAFSFVIGPSFYLLVVSLIRGPVPRKYFWHFAFPVLYLLLHIPFLILGDDFKFNAYVDSYRPDLSFRDVVYPYNPHLFVLTDYHSELTLVSLCFYALIGTREVVKAFQKKGESFWNPQHPVLRTLRLGTIQMISAFLIILFVKLMNENDYGDHYLAAYIAMTIYFTSFSVIKNSGFFKQASLEGQLKYKASSLTADQQLELLARLKKLMTSEKPFLKSDFCLPDLADQLNTSVHMLSQAINDGLKKSFFEMTAEYRIEEASKLLKEKPNFKVEEIAESVGYNSKSSFNTAFKKIKGQTPSEWRSTL